ncbi:MAG: hypothetical protein QM764_08935 [Chitinophagaceae bacterium]
MEAKKQRHIKPGYEYDKLFPIAENNDKTIRRNANLDDTVTFIPKVVTETTSQTKRIAKILKGRTIYDTCKNIWQFVYGYINYKKDKEGFEQVRSPARTWHDRKQGVDCDCYSVFISSILLNLGIPHILRITKYHRNYFQHIYPIVPNGYRHITIDCVTDNFDYEVPYSEKKDYPMDLQYLNGFDDGLAELGRILHRNMNDYTLSGKKAKKKKAAAALTAKTVVTSAAPGPALKKKKKGIFKKVLNVVNKVNPATVLLRNGVLAAMKLNIMNVAKRLRWSYLSPDKLAAKGIDPVRFQKLVATRQKLESIFYGAGGKPENLKKAILKGKGSKDKAVSGLGMLPIDEWSGYMNENTPLQQLLGDEIYFSENVQGMEGFRGFGELGEPVTLATVGAAMGVIAGIVAALKKVGDIFKKKDEPGSSDFDEAKTTAPENNVTIPASVSADIAKAVAPASAENTSVITADSTSESSSTVTKSESNLPAEAESRSMTRASEDGEAQNTTEDDTLSKSVSAGTGSSEKQSGNGFWDKNKKWLKPVAIGVGGLTVIAIGYKLLSGNKQPHKTSPKNQLSGIPHKRKKNKNHHRKHKHKRAVTLL